MSAKFVAASSQRLVCATHPLTAFPYTVALWAYPVSGALGTTVSLVDTGATSQYQRIIADGGGTSEWAISAAAGAGADNSIAGLATANQWSFLVARFISATSRQFISLSEDGTIVSVADATSRAFPTSAETLALGANEISTPADFFDGYLAEFWYTNTDIQPDAATLQSPMLQQLAFGGPFSVPHIAQAVVEYRSLRNDPISNDPREVYSRGSPQTWTNTNGVTVGPHPPLPYWYVKPSQTKNLLVI